MRASSIHDASALQSIIHSISEVIAPSVGAAGGVRCGVWTTCSVARYTSVKEAFTELGMLRVDNMFSLAGMWPMLEDPAGFQVRCCMTFVAVGTVPHASPRRRAA